MLWNRFSSKGPGNLVRVKGNTLKYLNIFSTNPKKIDCHWVSQKYIDLLPKHHRSG